MRDCSSVTWMTDESNSHGRSMRETTTEGKREYGRNKRRKSKVHFFLLSSMALCYRQAKLYSKNLLHINTTLIYILCMITTLRLIVQQYFARTKVN